MTEDRQLAIKAKEQLIVLLEQDLDSLRNQMNNLIKRKNKLINEIEQLQHQRTEKQ